MRYNQYPIYLSLERPNDIKQLASKLLLSYDQIFIDLKEMIRIGFLKQAHIDLNRNALVFSNPFVKQNSKMKEVEVEVCQNCGAKNTISHYDDKCKYYNQPLAIN